MARKLADPPRTSSRKPVRMVGVVGHDFPEPHLEFFKSRAIDTSGVTRLSGKTFRWRGKYGHDLNVAHTLETQLNVLQEFSAKNPDSFRDSRYVVLGNIAPHLQLEVLRQVASPRLIACDTMNFWIEGARKELCETLKYVHLLSINDAEARQLSGEHNLVKAAQAILRMGPTFLVIKRGEYGALLFTGDEIFSAPGFPLAMLKDPMGAGDSFAGGMMGYLARVDRIDAKALRQAVIMGSVLASFAVEDFSLDRFRTLTLADIQRRFAEFRELTHFEADLQGPTLHQVAAHVS